MSVTATNLSQQKLCFLHSLSPTTVDSCWNNRYLLPEAFRWYIVCTSPLVHSIRVQARAQAENPIFEVAC